MTLARNASTTVRLQTTTTEAVSHRDGDCPLPSNLRDVIAINARDEAVTLVVVHKHTTNHLGGGSDLTFCQA